MNDWTIVPQGKIFPSLLRVAKRGERRFDGYFKAFFPQGKLNMSYGTFFIVENYQVENYYRAHLRGCGQEPLTYSHLILRPLFPPPYLPTPGGLGICRRGFLTWSFPSLSSKDIQWHTKLNFHPADPSQWYTDTQPTPLLPTLSSVEAAERTTGASGHSLLKQ